jgi:thiamine kinase-like enzyme
MLEKRVQNITNFKPTEYIVGGTHNYTIKGIYKGEPALLKIWNRKLPSYKERFQNELEAYLDSNITCHPNLLEYDAKGTHLIVALVDGKLLSALDDRPNYRVTGNVVNTIKTLHKLCRKESTLGAYFGLLKVWIDRKFCHMLSEPGKRPAQFQTVLIALKKHYEKLCDAAKSHQGKIELSRVHGDFNFTNILHDDSKICLIDWEYSHIGSRYLDVSHITNNKDEFSTDFLKIYFKDDNFDQELYDFFVNFFLLKISVNYIVDKNKLANKSERKALIVKSKLQRLLDMQNITCNLEGVITS